MHNPSAQVVFLLAALSKAVASTITYPFSLAKARLQSGSMDDRKDTSSVKLAGEFMGARVPRNISTIVLHIAKTEGIQALYEGLNGEVLKGFFSHGITMIVKDAVHKCVIQLYYVILKLLRRYPSPQKVAEMAKEQAEQVAVGARDQGQQAVDAAKEGLQTFSIKITDAAKDG